MAATSIYDSSALETINPISNDNYVDVGEKRKREDPKEADINDSSSPVHPLSKTSLCSYFRRDDKSCSHGDSCRFAHGDSELRMKPDRTWDPTSERAKKLMKPAADEGKHIDVLMTEAFDGEFFNSVLSKFIVHLPMKWNHENLKKFLDEQGLVYKSAKKKKGMPVGFLSFENAEQVETATKELDGKSVGSKNLKVADAIPRMHEINRQCNSVIEQPLTSENDGISVSFSEYEEGDKVTDLPPNGYISRGRCARDVVTPLAHLPYADQLEHKKNTLKQNLKSLTKNARKACPKGICLPDWISKSWEIGHLPCKLEGIIKSPLINGYRNKCEFSVGYSSQGKPTVGFLLGNFREGVTAVEEPVDCPNISAFACKYALIFQEFLQNSSLPIWNRFHNAGFWRQLTVSTGHRTVESMDFWFSASDNDVREGRAPGMSVDVENMVANVSEIMLIIQVCSVGFDDERLTSELEKMTQAFFKGSVENSPPLPLTSLVVQDHTGISNVPSLDAPLRSLPIPLSEVGKPNHESEARIHDHINNLRFCISPTAFFQVNTLAAEKLFSLAGDWAGLTPHTLLFDICCGTGTIGLTLAERVGMVVGIEMNASAITDAYRNAEMNGIQNCRFVCGKAENVLGSLLKEYLCEQPQKQAEFSSAGIHHMKEEGASVNNERDPEDGIENEDSASPCLENGVKEVGNHQQSCLSVEGSNSIQQFQNVVVIVDPPRGGLHPTVIKALRTHSNLKRLVYISCNPESLVANAIELCTPCTDKSERGNAKRGAWKKMSSAGLARHRAKSMPISDPFRPVKAMGVDLFPHTPHCELLMLLER